MVESKLFCRSTMDASSINICFVGEMSVGKTTLLSLLLNVQCGRISRKRSTLSYNIFKENSTALTFPIIEEPTELSAETCTTLTYDIPKILFFGSDRKYSLSIVDTIGFNDNKFDDINMKYYKSIEDNIDIVVVVLDINKCLCTESERKIINMIGKHKLKMFILNKFDDVADKELNSFKEEIRQKLLQPELDSLHVMNIVTMSGLNLYSVHFDQDSAKSKFLLNLHDNVDKVDELYGYNNFSATLQKIIDSNIDKIYDKKLTMDQQSIEQTCKLYDIAKNLVANIRSVDYYIENCKYIGDKYANIDKYINKFNEETIKKIVEVQIGKDYNFNSFRHNNIALNCCIKKYLDLTRNSKYLSDYVRRCDKTFDYVYKILSISTFTYNGNLLDDISEVIDYLAKKIYGEIANYESYNHDLIKTLCYFRDIDCNIQPIRKIKMFIPNAALAKDLNEYVDTCKSKSFDVFPNLTLCLKFERIQCNYRERKKQWIKKYLSEGFVIFPCKLNKAPSITRWNHIFLNKSKRIYNFAELNIDSNCPTAGQLRKPDYFSENVYDENIGLLCGKASKILVIDIDNKDNGLSYWNSLIENNGQVNTLTVNTGGGGLHMYFKYKDTMKHWRSLNKMFSTDIQKIGIDLRTNNGYIIVPPSIHPTLNEYKFCDVTQSQNLRDFISDLPKWLFKLIDEYQSYRSIKLAS